MAAKNEQVKNVVLVGQGGVGKTMLAEAMLHLSGRTNRLGGHAGTKPTLDFDGEEAARGFSISTSMAPIKWGGMRLNILDAPCYPDFVGDAYAALSASTLLNGGEPERVSKGADAGTGVPVVGTGKEHLRRGTVEVILRPIVKRQVGKLQTLRLGYHPRIFGDTGPGTTERGQQCAQNE